MGVAMTSRGSAVCPRGAGRSLPDFAMAPAEFRRLIENMTLLKRLPTLNEVAKTAAFLASDDAAAITGAVANLTCGMFVD